MCNQYSQPRQAGAVAGKKPKSGNKMELLEVPFTWSYGNLIQLYGNFGKL
jgi:hypothetical protein